MYNGSGNLVIAMDENTYSYHGYSSSFLATSTATYQSLAYYSDSNNPNPASPPSANVHTKYFPNIKLEYTLPTNMSFDTLIVEQNNTILAVKGQENDILSVNAVMDGALMPYNVTALYFNTTGTTTLSEIDSAKAFYTSSSNQFSPVNQFGSVVTSVGSTINFTGSQTLSNADNYFWLVYYVNGNAVDGHFIDAGLDSMVVDSVTRIPAVSNPTGNRTIAGPYHGTYTLGPDTTDDFSSFNNAKAMLELLGISANVTILVDSGTYDESVEFGPIVGLSDTSRITFKGLGSNTVVTNTSATSSDRPIFRFNGVKFFVLDSLTIQRATSVSYFTGVHFMNQADSNTVKNCTIDCGANSTLSNINGIISSSNANYYYTNGNNANGLIIDNNTIIGGYYGITLRGTNTSVLCFNNTISNNTFTNQYYYSVYAYYLDSTTITGNDITSGSQTGNYFSAIYAGYGKNALTISKNKINLTKGSYGLYIYRHNYYTPNQDTALVSNNFIRINRTSGGYGYGIHNYYSKKVKYYNNSVNVTGNYASSRAMHVYYGSDDIIMKNNIFMNAANGYAIYSYVSNSHFENDYNNLYTTGANLAYLSGNKTDLAAWKTASADGVNSVNINPNYFSNNDLHTFSIPMNNLGTPLALVTDDIDDSLRSATTPDIGADEYTPPANDMAVVEWIAPLTGVALGFDTVKVKVVNYGTANQTNIPIKYSIDGGQTFTSAVIAGPINSTDTLDYTFLVPANMTSYGVYHCLAFTDLANEEVYSNDTVFMDIMACSPFVGNYTLGPDTNDFFGSFTELSTALTSCGISGSVTILVDSASFDENATFHSVAGASDTTKITIKGYGDQTVISNSNASSANRFIFDFNGAKHFVLDGLTIQKDTNVGYFWGVHFWHKADSNTVKNCTIDCGANSTSNNNILGIVASNSITSYGANGNNANGVVIDSNKIINGYSGIYFKGISTYSQCYDNRFTNNTLENQYYYPIYTYYQDGNKIIGNTINSGAKTSTGAYAIYAAYGKNALEISKNKINLNRGSYGLYIYRQNYYGSVQDSAIVSNNFIHVDRSVGGYGYGIYNNYTKKIKYLNNSVNITGNYSNSRAFYLSYYSQGVIIKNNIFRNNANGFAIYSSYSASYYENDYNNLYTSSPSRFCYQSGKKNNLAAWQSATSDAAHSVTIDPEFLSDSNLHTYSVAMMDLGTPLTEVTDDIDGEARSATTPDIGADEYVPPANDLSAVDVIADFNSYCGSADSLYVVIKNKGTATQYSVPVHFAGTSPSGAVNLTATIDSIHSLEFDTVYMGVLAATAPGMYSAKAYATLATDTMINNDTMSVTGEVYFPDSIGYVETFDSLNPRHWDMNGDGTFHWMHHSSGAMYANFWSHGTGQTCEMISPTVNVPSGKAAYLGFQYAYHASSYNDTLEVYAKSCGDANWTLIWKKYGDDLETPGGGNTSPGTYNDAGIQLPASMLGTNVRIKFRGISAWGPNLYIDGVAIINAPVVTLGPDTALCAGDSVTYDAGVFYGANYLWTKGIDTVGTNQTFTATIAGTYVAKVTQFGASGVDAFTVTFNPKPAASFTGLNSSYCDNEMPATLMPTPAGGTFTGNGITGYNFDPATSGTGNHIITYTFTTSAGCTSIATDTTDVFEAAVVTLTDTTICDGDSVMLTAGSNTPPAPSLIFSAYIEGSSNNKALEVYNATTDTLNLDNYSIMTNYNGNPWSGQYHFPAGTMLAPGDVFVIGNAAADSVILAVTDDTLAYNQGGYVVGFNGDDVRALYKHTATDSVMIDIIGRYDLVDPGKGWDVAGVTNATKDHSLVRKSTIVIGNTDWTAIAGTDSVSSEYLVYPKDTFTYLGSHSATPPVFVPNTYLWSTGDTTATITVKPSMTTTYTVTVDNGNCQTYDSMVVNVNPLPIVNLGPDTSFKWTWESITLDAGNPNASWLWSTGGIAQTETFDSTILSKGANTVYVTVTENNCSASDTVIITVIDDVSINGSSSNLNIEVYPNPTKGQFNMTINGYKGNVQMQIVDLAGQVVHSEKINVTANYIGKFDVSKLSSGVYYIKLTSNNVAKVERLIIQK
jgi:parallel beta-helix repeat protein